MRRFEEHSLSQRLDGVTQRLDLVETTLHDLAEQRRFLVRYTRATAERESHLEPRVNALEATSFKVANIKMAYVFYVDDPKKRAVGFKLSDGMDVPAELAARFKFARQKSKLAGTIRGSFFVIKGEH